jgi:hypothetical protein
MKDLNASKAGWACSRRASVRSWRHNEFMQRGADEGDEVAFSPRHVHIRRDHKLRYLLGEWNQLSAGIASNSRTSPDARQTTA